MQRIALALGLSAEAGEEAILAEITKLKGTSETITNMEEEMKKKETENETLTNRIKVLDEEQVDGLLEHHNIHLIEHAKRLGLAWNPQVGVIEPGGKIIASEEEQDIFRALHLEYVKPEDRER